MQENPTAKRVRKPRYYAAGKRLLARRNARKAGHEYCPRFRAGDWARLTKYDQSRYPWLRKGNDNGN